jgi:hypothetical protein
MVLRVLGVLGTGSGCGVGCTLIGCDSGLAIRISPRPVSPYRAELLLDDGTRRVWRCDRATCGDPFFADYLKSIAIIDVIVGTDTTHAEQTKIQYERSQPNGAKCGPTCYRSEVTVSLGR